MDFGPADADPEDTGSEPTDPEHAGSGARPLGRVLGLDVGARRIGVAVSDALGITAQGLETLQRRNKKHDFDHLKRVIRRYEVKEIVVGLPLRMSGAEGIQSDKMNVFAEELRKRFRLPVHLWDERLTSAEANRLPRDRSFHRKAGEGGRSHGRHSDSAGLDGVPQPAALTELCR